MNKLIILTFVAALVGLIEARSVEVSDPLEEFSEAALAPSDEDETSRLQGDAKRFSEYCIRYRDYVLNDVEQHKNQFSAGAFNLFMDSVKEVGQEAVNVGQLSMATLGSELASPKTVIEDAQREHENEVEAILAEGKQKMQQDQKSLAILDAFKYTFKAMATQVGKNLNEKFARLKELVNTRSAAMVMLQSCDKIKEYENKMNEQFYTFRAGLVEQQPAFNKYQPLDVPCLTTFRISIMNNVCSFVSVVKNPLMNIYAAGQGLRVKNSETDSSTN